MGLLASANSVWANPPLLLDWGGLETTSAERQLETRTIQTASRLTTVQRLSARRGTAPWLVQFNDVIREEWKTALTEAGAEIRGYMPENGFLVLATPKQMRVIAQWPDVVYAGEFLPEFKQAKRVRHEVSTMSGDEVRTCNIWLYDPVDTETVAAALTAMPGVTLSHTEFLPDRGLIRGTFSASVLEEAAAWGEVEWIEPYFARRLWNDVAVGATMMGVTNAWSVLGLTGAGQTIAICDTGLDTGNPSTIHQDFTNRVTGYGWSNGLYNAAYSWADTDSHGTHVAGSVAGSGAMSAGRYKGTAHGANVVFQGAQADLSGIPANLGTLFKQAYDNGARIHSDSWGYDDDGYYNADSRYLDMYVWSNKTFLVLIAAGNQGVDTNNIDGVVDLDSIGSPGTAKNCLTVGAAENYRTSGGYSTYQWGIDLWPDDYPSEPIRSDYASRPATGGIQGMAAFSSRGPCDDGRIKPDIVAPGTDIASTRSRRSSKTGWGVVSGNTNYLYMGGTSMATPLTAGAAGLVRQWLVTAGGVTNPSAALVKAMMINGARNMAPGQYGTGATQEIPSARPNQVTGWGHVDIYRSLVPPTNRVMHLFDTNSLSTGQSNIFTYAVSSATTNKFVITLAYSDYWGTVGSGKQLVNDLDLTLRKPSGATVYANGRSSLDATNNVEMIEFAPDEVGTYTVVVKARTVPSGGSQAYALVIAAPVTGVAAEPPSAPVSVWASATNTTGFTAAWSSSSGATSYRLDVSSSSSFASGGGGGGTLLTNDFNAWDNSSWVDGWSNNSGTIYPSDGVGGTRCIGMNASNDWIRAPAVTNPASVSFTVRTSSDPGNWTMEVQSSPDGTNWTTRGTVIENGTGGDVDNTHRYVEIPLNLTGTIYLRWYMIARSADSCYIDNVAVSGGGSSSPAFVSGYSNLTVNGTSQVVTGLVSGTSYYFRVRAASTNGISGNSPTGVVTTLGGVAGTPPVVNPISAQAVTVGLDFEVTVTATENDGDTVTFACTSGVDENTWLLDDATGDFLFIPTSAQIGANVFTFTASDKDGVSSPVAMTVTVSAASGGTPSVTLGATRIIVEEDSGLLVVPVTLSSPADATVNLRFAGTLQHGVDLTGATSLVFTAGGSASGQFVFAVVDDALEEGPETARITLYPVSGMTNGAVTSAVAVVRDNDAFAIVAANLTGASQLIEAPGSRMLEALAPDVVLIQEFLMTNGITRREWVDRTFGTTYAFMVETNGSSTLPNGIISRWPFVTSGVWTASNINNRDYAWATIDLPGNRDLHAVSVHLLTTSSGDRSDSARALTNYVAQAGWATNDFLVIGGDLNTETRTESAVTILSSKVTDAIKPADQTGDWDTNEGRANPYDYVLPNGTLNTAHRSLTFYGYTFANGMVFDSRLTWNNGLPPPVLAGDSSLVQHMPVVKIFALDGEEIPPLGVPTNLRASATNTTGFTAAWDAATEAEGYRIDVSEDAAFSGAGGPVTDLLISEYIEGSSNNKAVEFYNGTGASIDLAAGGYVLHLYFNGSLSATVIPLTGSVAAAGTFVIANNTANSAILAQADQTSGGLTFNGNDVVALVKSGVTVDQLGTLGSSLTFAAEVTKVRKSSVSQGVTVYDAAEWDDYAADTTAYLGAHVFAGGTGSAAYVDGYENLAVTGTSVAVTGLVSGTTYYFRVRSVRGAEISANSMTASVMTITSEDMNDNGIPDDWEDQYFVGTPGYVITDTSDADNDGIFDWQEFVAGTIPTDAGSGLRLAPDVAPLTAPVPDAVLIQWDSVTGRTYRLGRNTNLLNGFVWTEVPATPPVNVYTDAPPVGGNTIYYRIEVKVGP